MEQNSGSPERVALELARQIWQFEKGNASSTQDDRAKLLDLYAECLRAAVGKR